MPNANVTSHLKEHYYYIYKAKFLKFLGCRSVIKNVLDMFQRNRNVPSEKMLHYCAHSMSALQTQDSMLVVAVESEKKMLTMSHFKQKYYARTP